MTSVSTDGYKLILRVPRKCYKLPRASLYRERRGRKRLLLNLRWQLYSVTLGLSTFCAGRLLPTAIYSIQAI